MKRVTVLVSGKVQEVGYRERVVTIAKVFMLTGMVQNLEDGRVRIIAEGEENKLKSFIDAINIKNTMILVENVDIAYSNATGDYNDFYKLVGVGETDSRLDTASKYLKELIGVVKEFKEESSRKQDIILEIANHQIEITQQGFNGINSKMDIMIEKQNIMIEKQTETISTIQNESELTRKELGSEIRLFNVDSRDHVELNYRDIKEETKDIKEDIRDIKEEIKNIKISLKKQSII